MTSMTSLHQPQSQGNHLVVYPRRRSCGGGGPFARSFSRSRASSTPRAAMSTTPTRHRCTAPTGTNDHDGNSDFVLLYSRNQQTSPLPPPSQLSSGRAGGSEGQEQQQNRSQSRGRSERSNSRMKRRAGESEGQEQQQNRSQSRGRSERSNSRMKRAQSSRAVLTAPTSTSTPVTASGRRRGSLNLRPEMLNTRNALEVSSSSSSLPKPQHDNGTRNKVVEASSFSSLSKQRSAHALITKQQSATNLTSTTSSKQLKKTNKSTKTKGVALTSLFMNTASQSTSSLNELISNSSNVHPSTCSPPTFRKQTGKNSKNQHPSSSSNPGKSVSSANSSQRHNPHQTKSKSSNGGSSCCSVSNRSTGTASTAASTACSSLPRTRQKSTRSMASPANQRGDDATKTRRSFSTLRGRTSTSTSTATRRSRSTSRTRSVPRTVQSVQQQSKPKPLVLVSSDYSSFLQELEQEAAKCKKSFASQKSKKPATVKKTSTTPQTPTVTATTRTRTTTPSANTTTVVYNANEVAHGHCSDLTLSYHHSAISLGSCNFYAADDDCDAEDGPISSLSAITAIRERLLWLRSKGSIASSSSSLNDDATANTTPIPTFEHLVVVDRTWRLLKETTCNSSVQNNVNDHSSNGQSLDFTPPYKDVLGRTLIARVLTLLLFTKQPPPETTTAAFTPLTLDEQIRLSGMRGTERSNHVAQLLVEVVDLIVSLLGSDLVRIATFLYLSFDY